MKCWKLLLVPVVVPAVVAAAGHAIAVLTATAVFEIAAIDTREFATGKQLFAVHHDDVLHCGLHVFLLLHRSILLFCSVTFN